MREIDLVYRTMLAELGQRALDGQFQADFPLTGRFVSVPVKGKAYWYFDEPTGEGDKRRYVGPASDPEITARVEAHKEIKDDMRARRNLVGTLLRNGGMNGPDRFAGDIIQALAGGGFFRLRGVLIGTAAFGCYAGLVGVRLPNASLQTGDADFAQDFAISGEVGDSLPPVLDLLQTVDASFRAVPHPMDKVKVAAFANRSGYRVEFLTGNRGGDDYTGKPSPMPALGGASAVNLRYLDFLIRDPVRTVLLHRAGVSVLVPSPERYAVHKLIVASQRLAGEDGRLKRDKDALQASLLCEGLYETRRGDELADAFNEAWERGPSWREAITAGVKLMTEKGKAALTEAVGERL